MKHREWEPHEEVWLKENHRKLSYAECARHLGRSLDSVRGFIQRWILSVGQRARKNPPKRGPRRTQKCWWCRLPAPVLVVTDSHTNFKVCLECKPQIPPLPNKDEFTPNKEYQPRIFQCHLGSRGKRGDA